MPEIKVGQLIAQLTQYDPDLRVAFRIAMDPIRVVYADIDDRGAVVQIVLEQADGRSDEA